MLHCMPHVCACRTAARRSKPELRGQYPPVSAADVVIYDDECRSRVVSAQRIITLSFDVPAGAKGRGLTRANMHNAGCEHGP